MRLSTRLIRLFIFLFLAGAITGISCKKKEIQGPKGDPGTPGGGGNSNISSSSVFVVASSQWKTDSTTKALVATIPAPLITQEVYDKGSVKVYIQNGTTWFELPYDEGDLFTQYGFEVGVLILNYINIEGGFTPPRPTANYRMVVLSEI